MGLILKLPDGHARNLFGVLPHENLISAQKTEASALDTIQPYRFSSGSQIAT